MKGKKCIIQHNTSGGNNSLKHYRENWHSVWQMRFRARERKHVSTYLKGCLVADKIPQRISVSSNAFSSFLTRRMLVNEYKRARGIWISSSHDNF